VLSPYRRITKIDLNRIRRGSLIIRRETRKEASVMTRARFAAAGAMLACIAITQNASPAAQDPLAGARYKRLVVKGAMLIDGLGSPARGPVDIVVENDTVTDIVAVDGVTLSSSSPSFKRPTGDRVIEAEGMYVLPGLIEMHGHTPEGRVVAGTEAGRSYAYQLWLAHGVTTVRDVGAHSGLTALVDDLRRSNALQLAAPHVIPYEGWRGYSAAPDGKAWTHDSLRAFVEEAKKGGAAGIKVFGPTYTNTLAMLTHEAKAAGLGVAVHYGVGDADAAGGARAGITSIEHWYGIPDSAIPGAQSLPADYNFLNELDRFRYAGQIWRQADPALLDQEMNLFIEKGTVLVPTFVAYEPNRDLMRAQNMAWYPKYALPVMLEYWKPNPSHHGSYHYEWTTDDEANWRENFRLWMTFVREFWKRGGRLNVGSDPGGSFGLFGFTYIRELELYREMGLNPINIIEVATTAAARTLGLDRLAGGIRVGGQADLIIVDGNPLRDLKVLYGTGVTRLGKTGKIEQGGGVRYTIREGIVYDARLLLKNVEGFVRQAPRVTPSS
jgi:cytosine/adenosine deaminase-related metal-dependent hydrolase